jgi:hypothetical protein
MIHSPQLGNGSLHYALPSIFFHYFPILQFTPYNPLPSIRGVQKTRETDKPLNLKPKKKTVIEETETQKNRNWKNRLSRFGFRFLLLDIRG